MTDSNPTRVDEVSTYFDTAETIELAGKYLFALIAILSFCMPFAAKMEESVQSNLKIAFISIVGIYFALFQLCRFYLIPKAERIRRKQLLSNAFGVSLTHERTELYYNNEYAPSVIRLGANILENSLFSKEIAGKMLVRSRLVTGGYVILWIVAFAMRHNNLEVLISITQLVFSTEIVAQWINLEVLHFRHERVFDELHSHFLHEVGQDSTRAVATILDAFADYEAAKSSAGLLLSTKVFEKLNPTLTQKWEQIRKDLKMGVTA